ncbi:rhamnogalacturonan acetylesterase [Thalassotalea castellviae]|uniref:Rhamnogalacturonan acetylesterase n=1 Tax=Thalassotalea castellviae TaxID=3075612 RepID=A0ABU2ZXU9_9GAMM|nr:rhamnogalacturonan acetylesterase [Thalassotalea sp. W431]MDT0602505.1 rhamnogalacturonan acetylesterase [Thalassotalea sp. W431]
MKIIVIVFTIFCLFTGIKKLMAVEVTTKIFMAGDSTMSNKDIKDYPETGWGMPFSYFFDESVAVENRARNGRSTKTFISEGLWKEITEELSAGDHVIIQFGHNDQSKHKTDRYTSPVDFKENLTLFINQTISKNAMPILMTPITRRYFSKDGKIKDTHPIYADLVREVADETKVIFIDMEKITQDYFQGLGDEKSALRFMHIKANLHPNYPNGIKDNTHLNALGAREVAQLVLSELRKINHSLIKVLRTADSKHLKYSY